MATEEKYYNAYFKVHLNFVIIKGSTLTYNGIKAKMLADLKEVLKNTYDTYNYGFAGYISIDEISQQDYTNTKPELDFLE
jgi:hypothetical protein